MMRRRESRYSIQIDHLIVCLFLHLNTHVERTPSVFYTAIRISSALIGRHRTAGPRVGGFRRFQCTRKVSAADRDFTRLFKVP